MKCAPGHFFSNKKCVSKCQVGYFGNQNTGKYFVYNK